MKYISNVKCVCVRQSISSICSLYVRSIFHSNSNFRFYSIQMNVYWFLIYWNTTLPLRPAQWIQWNSVRMNIYCECLNFDICFAVESVCNSMGNDDRIDKWFDSLNQTVFAILAQTIRKRQNAIVRTYQLSSTLWNWSFFH